MSSEIKETVPNILKKWSIFFVFFQKIQLYDNQREKLRGGEFFLNFLRALPIGNYMNENLQKLKIKVIPMLARGELTQRKAAEIIGIRQISVWRLKERYLKYGEAAFIHGNTGRTSQNKKFNYGKIADDYKLFNDAPFGAFRDNCEGFLGYSPSYTTVYNALSTSGSGIFSPRAHIPVREKKKHLPRSERPNEGDLIQIDASQHAWFLHGQKVRFHGAIDDTPTKLLRSMLFSIFNTSYVQYERTSTGKQFGSVIVFFRYETKS